MDEDDEDFGGFSGIEITDDGHKEGLNGVDNGRLAFHGVRVPRENLLDRYGTEVGRRGIKHDDSLSLDQFPDIMIKALVSTEDRRFYEHWGIDPIGTLLALLAALGELTPGVLLALLFAIGVGNALSAPTTPHMIAIGCASRRKPW